MATETRNTLKGWFETGDIPTQAQFAALIEGVLNLQDDDYKKVPGLENLLNGKASLASVNSLVTQLSALNAQQITDKAELLAAINEVLESSGSGSYTRSSPASRTVGGVTTGESLTNKTYDELFEMILAPYTAPTTSVVISPQSPYNERNVVKTVTFTWTKETGTPDLDAQPTGAQIQWRRGTSGTWLDLSTTVTGSGTTRDASASTATLNTGGPDNTPVQFQVIWKMGSKTEIYPSSPKQTGFAGYAAAIAVLSLSLGSKQIRSLGTTFSNVISGSITRQSPNVPLSEYKIQSDYNDNSWVDLVAYRSIAAAGGTLASNGGNVTDTAQPNGKSTIRYRVMAKDSDFPSGAAISDVASLSIVNPVFTGMTTASSISALDPATLSVASSAYAGETTDKNINGLVFTAASNRFCGAWPAAYSTTLATFFDTATFENLALVPSNFITGTKNVTFADGTVVSYFFWIYSTVVTSGTYTINVN